MGRQRRGMNMRARTMLKTIVSALALLMLATTAASAHDHRPPAAPVLRIGDQRQVGWFAGEQWITGDGEHCVRMYGTGVFQFPRALRYRDGQTPAITIRRAAAPSSVELHAWRAVNRYGYPKGRAEAIPVVTTPVVPTPGATPTAWKVTFAPPPNANHLYLILDVKWLDQEQCAAAQETDSQWATWIFHIRRVQ